MAKYCKKCGAEIKDNALFCPQCGAKGDLAVKKSTNENNNRNKYLIIGLIAVVAILAAGVLYAHNLSTLTALPKNFGYNMSIMILVFVVLGGIGNIRGSIISAVILTLLPELLRGLSDYRMLIYAIVLIGMMLFNWCPAAINWKTGVKEKYFSKISFLNRKEKGVK